MVAPERPIYRAIFLFVLAPVAAAVLVGALLLFGVSPRAVFFVGHKVKALFNASNAVGVLSTVFFWWIVIVAIGLAWERHRRRS